jgi:hypothetical protein
MKTTEIVVLILASAAVSRRTDVFRSEPIVHSGVIAEDKDVAGMAEQTPWIKLYLAGAGESPDWCEKPVEQLML